MAVAIPYVAMALAAYMAYDAQETAEARQDQVDADNRELQKRSNASVMESMRSQYEQLSGQEDAAQREQLENSMQNQQDAAAARGRVNLMAASTGMGGLSIENMFWEVNKSEQSNLNTILFNHETAQNNIAMQAEQTFQNTKGSISNRNFNTPHASDLSKSLRIGMAAYQGYTMGSGLQGNVNDMSGARSGPPAPIERGGAGLAPIRSGT